MRIALGIILLILPLFLTFYSSSRRYSFIKLLSAVIAAQAGIGIITQALGIFNEITVLTATLLFDIGIFYYYLPTIQIVKPTLRIDVAALAVLLVSISFLYVVHYNYKGAYITTLSAEYLTTDGLSYPYPYFSDEWYAVAFMEDSITHASLPIYFPFSHERTLFLNFELLFHSFLSEVTLLFGLHPLFHYVLLSIGCNALMILLLYLFLRTAGVAYPSSTLSSLLALFITSGASLPGLWHLIPISLGIMALFLFLIHLIADERRWSLLCLLLTVSFYPPLILFTSTAYIIRALLHSATRTIAIKRIAIYILLVTLVTLLFLGVLLIDGAHPIGIALILLQAGLIIALLFYGERLLANRKALYAYLFNCILFISVDAYFLFGVHALSAKKNALLNILYHYSIIGTPVLSFSLPDIIPWLTITGAIVGGGMLIQKRNGIWLVSTIAVGALFWMAYSQTNYRFIIEYERVVYITALLTTMLAGFGFAMVASYLTNLFPQYSNRLYSLLQIGILSAFILLIPTYTERDLWKNIALIAPTGEVILPAPPANTYLHPEDIRIFSTRHHARVLTYPWKGTVLGTATDVIPLSAKSGTITIDPITSGIFVLSDCEQRSSIVNTVKAEYVYFQPFECEGFTEIDRSAEGIALYKTWFAKDF